MSLESILKTEIESLQMVRFGEKFLYVGQWDTIIAKDSIQQVEMRNGSVRIHYNNDYISLRETTVDLNSSAQNIQLRDSDGDRRAVFAKLSAKELMSCFAQWIDPLWEGSSHLGKIDSQRA